MESGRRMKGLLLPYFSPDLSPTLPVLLGQTQAVFQFAGKPGLLMLFTAFD